MNLIEPSNIKDNALSPKPCDTFLNRESIHPRAESTFSQLLQNWTIEQRISPLLFRPSLIGHNGAGRGSRANHRSLLWIYNTENGSVTASTTFQHLSLPLLFSNNHSFSLFHSPAIHLVNTIPLSLFLAPHSLYFSLDAIKRRQTRMRLTWRKREREDVRLVCNVTI